MAIYEVRLTDDGAAYDRSEWHGCWHACVEYGKDRGWTFYGQPTPGGQPGTVTVEEV